MVDVFSLDLLPPFLLPRNLITPPTLIYIDTQTLNLTVSSRRQVHKRLTISQSEDHLATSNVPTAAAG